MSTSTFSIRFFSISTNQQTAQALVHMLQGEAETGVVSKNVVSLKTLIRVRTSVHFAIEDLLKIT